MRKRAWVWVGLALLVVIVVALNAARGYLTVQQGAEEACAAYLSAELGEKVKARDVQATVPEVYFPTRFDKRFRSTCTFSTHTVVLESAPLKPWRVVKGLD